MKTRQHEDDGNMKSTGSQQQIGEHQFAAFEVMQKKNVAFKSTKVSIVESGLCSCDRREKKKKKWFPSSSHKSESKNYRLLERNTQKPGQQQSSHRSSSTHRIKTVFFFFSSRCCFLWRLNVAPTPKENEPFFFSLNRHRPETGKASIDIFFFFVLSPRASK